MGSSISCCRAVSLVLLSSSSSVKHLLAITFSFNCSASTVPQSIQARSSLFEDFRLSVMSLELLQTTPRLSQKDMRLRLHDCLRRFLADVFYMASPCCRPGGVLGRRCPPSLPLPPRHSQSCILQSCPSSSVVLSSFVLFWAEPSMSTSLRSVLEMDLHRRLLLRIFSFSPFCFYTVQWASPASTGFGTSLTLPPRTSLGLGYGSVPRFLRPSRFSIGATVFGHERNLPGPALGLYQNPRT